MAAVKRAQEVKESILKRCPVRALATLDKNMMLGDPRNRDLLSLFLNTLDWDSRTGGSTTRHSSSSIDKGTTVSAGEDSLNLFKVALK